MATTGLSDQLGKLTELRQRLLFVLGALFVYRVGAHIPIPGIDPNALADLFSQQGGFLDMVNMFSGGGFQAAQYFRAGDHALYLGLDHRSTDERGDPSA